MKNKQLLKVYTLEGQIKVWQSFKELSEKQIRALNNRIQQVLMDEAEEEPAVAAPTGCERCG